MQDVDYRESPAASLCSLERVVRPAPTEGPLDRRKGWVRCRGGGVNCPSGEVIRHSGGVICGSSGVNCPSGGVNRRSGGVSRGSGGVNCRSGGVSRGSGGVSRGSGGVNCRSGGVIRGSGGVRNDAVPPAGETQGLTNSSSATETGEDRLNHEKEPAASLCSLERVVRSLAVRVRLRRAERWIEATE